MNLQFLGKTLILCGAFLLLLGGMLLLANKIPFAGRLPGDILIQRKNFTQLESPVLKHGVKYPESARGLKPHVNFLTEFTFYFPLATSILLSLVITGLLYLFGKR